MWLCKILQQEIESRSEIQSWAASGVIAKEFEFCSISLLAVFLFCFPASSISLLAACSISLQNNTNKEVKSNLGRQQRRLPAEFGINLNSELGLV